MILVFVVGKLVDEKIEVGEEKVEHVARIFCNCYLWQQIDHPEIEFRRLKLICTSER